MYSERHNRCTVSKYVNTFKTHNLKNYVTTGLRIRCIFLFNYAHFFTNIYVWPLSCYFLKGYRGIILTKYPCRVMAFWQIVALILLNMCMKFHKICFNTLKVIAKVKFSLSQHQVLRRCQLQQSDDNTSPTSLWKIAELKMPREMNTSIFSLCGIALGVVSRAGDVNFG